jgi:hypothetical protein
MPGNIIRAEEAGNLDWFVNQLADYSAESTASRDDSQLLKLADRLRSGGATLEDQQTYKRAVLAYIQGHLSAAPRAIQSTFLEFLLLSGLASESIEVRNSLDELAIPDDQGRLSDLTLDIAALLLSGSRPPSDNTARRIFSLLRAQYQRSPNWRDASILAAIVGRPTTPQYHENDLVSDLALLSGAPQFEQELAMRPPI